MNQGVQILLERMESNPDEFTEASVISKANKWANIIVGVRMRMDKIINNPDERYTFDELSYLTNEEVLALDAKLTDIRRDAFTKNVMSTILAGADDGNYHSFAQAQSEVPILNTSSTTGKYGFGYEDHMHNNSIARVFGKGK